MNTVIFLFRVSRRIRPAETNRKRLRSTFRYLSAIRKRLFSPCGMADKGFVIQDLLTPIGCSVTMPAFLSSKTQFAKDELLKSKEIHNVREHVERAIRRVKEFHYFD